MTSDFIDQIYEASFVPELWPSVLDRLAQMTQSYGGLLFCVRERVLNWTSSSALSDVFQTYVSEGWFKRCSRQVCIMSQTQPLFLGEYDFWTPEQLDSNPIYRDFFRPRGLGWSAGTGMPLPSGDNIVFSVERQFQGGPIEDANKQRLNEMRPHLARAAMVAARLGMQKAMGAQETLELMGMPCALLNSQGSVLAANSQAQDLTEIISWLSQDRIAFADKQATIQLQQALDGLLYHSPRSVCSFAVRDEHQIASHVAHIVPIKRSAHDLFAHSYAMMIIMPVASPSFAPVALIRTLFDLTASEARIAQALGQGESLEEIAASGGVSINTVRSQLKLVFEKTGCSRQAEVCALMNRISLTRDMV